MDWLIVLLSILATSPDWRTRATETDRLSEVYVEGESKVIWIPDGDGRLHRVDLTETAKDDPNSGEKNVYLLYTATKPPGVAQVITYGDIASVSVSGYNRSHPLIVITHSWRSNALSSHVSQIRDAFLRKMACNVLVLNWQYVAAQNYPTATKQVHRVGRFLANFVEWLFTTSRGRYERTHMIGFGLGAHVIGVTGKLLKGKAARVTGLDPIGPLWSAGRGLGRGAAQYVEVFHTDAGWLGTALVLGHSDYFPNGGRHPQPNCLHHTCSHFRAWQYFVASLTNPKLIIANACSSHTHGVNNKCAGKEMEMGNFDFHKPLTGIFASSVSLAET